MARKMKSSVNKLEKRGEIQWGNWVRMETKEGRMAWKGKDGRTVAAGTQRKTRNKTTWKACGAKKSREENEGVTVADRKARRRRKERGGQRFNFIH
ncbi:hypothetical protein J437_LFUL007912 [Ladona fulva]|uniref:Uncharacterized protein n=1 Tax=Ladona fulva TaxID=123851 RepID=A0A8K0K8K5_LADFU|nr:hypothetical protein J437_LFUL007912 [Ladona fulva]